MTTWSSGLATGTTAYSSGLPVATDTYTSGFATGTDSYSSELASGSNTYTEETLDHGWPSLLVDVDGNDLPGYYVDATLIDCLGDNIWTAGLPTEAAAVEVTLGGEEVHLGGEDVTW